MALSPVSELIGRVLAGRYRLTAPVGVGASAQVYVADDVQLRRRVAVKVLHPALAHDPTFLRRFQAEAQAAAALNHPNVLAVYDWGRDGVPFLVTEYLEGGSLQGILDGGRLLSLSQALVVGLDAARGLHYAHSRGFAHRDVKPANLLFGEDRRLRVADFGLARALAEAAWTEPEGVVLGTARYVSPEQAAGGSLDGRSDVYSLALVLVEAVTGTVPHTADTALGSLRARIGRSIDAPPELGPLAPVVEAAGRADPTRRSSAAELGRSLMTVARQLRSPELLPLAPPDLGPRMPAALADDAVDTVGTAGAAWLAGPAGSPPADGAAPASARREPGPGPPGRVDGATEAGAVGAGASPTAGSPTIGAAGSAPAGATAATADAGTAPAGAAASAAPTADATAAGRRPPVAAPDIGPDVTALGPTGGPAARVGADRPGSINGGAPAAGGGTVVAPARPFEAEGDEPGPDEPDGGRVRRGRRSRRARRRDAVGQHRPRRLGRWAVGLLLVAALATLATIGVSLARGWGEPRLIAVPEFVGRTEAQVTSLLPPEADWRVRYEDVRRDGSVAGRVLGQDPPAGGRLVEGGTLHLQRSIGEGLRKVPEVAQLSVDQAAQRLEAIGLTAGPEQPAYDEQAPPGTVLSAVERGKELPRGAPVTLVVSQGPAPRPIPDVSGQRPEQATAALQALGLAVTSAQDYSETVPSGAVIGTNPATGGDPVPKGSTVTLIVSLGPRPVPVADVIGLGAVEASDTLEGQGFVVRTDGPANRPVIATDPAAGIELNRGATVYIITQRT